MGIIIQVPGGSSPARVYSKWKIVENINDFPPPVGNVITLPVDTNWDIVAKIDMGVIEIVTEERVSIRGHSAETTGLYSQKDGGNFITTDGTLVLKDMAIGGDGTATKVYIDGTTNIAAVDWHHVNFTGGGLAIHFKNIENAILQTLAFFAKNGIYIEGNASTIGITDTIWTSTSGDGDAYGLRTDPGATISRRLRIDKCAAIATSTNQMFDIDPSAITPAEGFHLNMVNFSGGGDYLPGINFLNDKARFSQSRGIINTTRIGSMYYNGVGIGTACTLNTPVKANVLTIAGADNQRFLHDDILGNWLQYTSEFITTHSLILTITLAAFNSNRIIDIEIRKNGVPIPGAKNSITTLNGVRPATVPVIGKTELALGDIIEVWMINRTSSTTVVIEDFNLSVGAANV